MAGETSSSGFFGRLRERLARSAKGLTEGFTGLFRGRQIDAELRNRFRHHAGVKQDLEKVSRCVTAGSMTPAAATHRLLNHLQETN